MSQDIEAIRSKPIEVLQHPKEERSVRVLDVALDRDITDVEHAIISAYWEGSQMDTIVLPDVTPAMIKKTCYGTDKFSIKQRIYRAYDHAWMPQGLAQLGLWMYKHGGLSQIPLAYDHDLQHQRLFNDTQLMVARFYLAGMTRTDELEQIFKHTSNSTLRNVINGSTGSIAQKIYAWTGNTYYPAHKLAACLWMVKRGVIPENVIGEALP